MIQPPFDPSPSDELCGHRSGNRLRILCEELLLDNRLDGSGRNILAEAGTSAVDVHIIDGIQRNVNHGALRLVAIDRAATAHGLTV